MGECGSRRFPRIAGVQWSDTVESTLWGMATGAIFTGPRTISRMTATPAAFPQCTSYNIRPLYPAIRGKTTTFTPPLMCAAPPCDYKRRRRASFRRDASRRDPSSLTLWHPYSPRSIPLLAETWEPSPLSRLACTPYYKHIGCKIIQCLRTPPLLDVRPRSRNQDKSCVTVLSLASSSGTRKHAAFTCWDPGPRVGTPTLIKGWIKLQYPRKQANPLWDLHHGVA